MGWIAKARKFVRRTRSPAAFLNGLKTGYAIAFRPRVTPAQIMTAQIEITLRCNLACPMCENPLIQENKGDMTFEQFKGILDQMPYLISLNLTGIGESLMNKDVWRMLEYAKRKGVYVWFTTNGTILTESIARKLIQVGVDELVISFDGASSDTFDKIRLGARFADVVRNLERLQRIKRELKRGNPKLAFGITVVRDNLGEVPDIVRIAAGLGIQETIIGTGLVELDSPDAILDPNTPKPTRGQIAAMIDRAQRIGKEDGVMVRVAVPETARGKECNCIKPWTTCYITKDGWFFPCCEVTQRRIPRDQLVKHALGNVITGRLADFWNGEGYQKLRRGISDPRERWDLCTGCVRCHQMPGEDAQPDLHRRADVGRGAEAEELEVKV